MNLVKEKNNDYIEKKSIAYLFIVGLLLFISDNIENTFLTDVIYIASGVFGYIISPFLPMAIWVFAFSMDVQIDTFAEAPIMLIATLPLLINIRHEVKNFCFFACSELVFLLAYVLGYQPKIQYYVTQIFVFMCFYLIIELRNTTLNKLLIIGLAISGLFMMYSVTNVILNTSILGITRLVYNEHVRTLATALTFTIYYLFIRIIKWDDNYKKIYRILYILLFAIAIGLIWCTYSRGCLLAIGFGILAYFLCSFKSNGMKSILLVLLFMILLFGAYRFFNISNDMLMDSRSYYERLRIYDYYIRKVFHNGFIRLLFGFGSGNLQRVADVSDYAYYPHSAFLDYFFSFGLCGAIIIIIMTIRTIKNAFQSKNAAVIGLCCLVIALYIPFASCENLTFHIALALCFGHLFENYSASNMSEMNLRREE